MREHLIKFGDFIGRSFMSVNLVRLIVLNQTIDQGFSTPQNHFLRMNPVLFKPWSVYNKWIAGK
jgi:hypothetical protein